MANHGIELLDRALELAARARDALAGVPGLCLLQPADAQRDPPAAAADPLKLVLSLPGTGADGFAVKRDLLDQGVRVEMADRDTLVPLLTIGDDELSIDRLVTALLKSLSWRRRGPRAVTASTSWAARPQMAMTPREAFFAPSERVSAERAVSRISAETAAPYPPGIPAIAPGEVITEPLLRALQAEADAGTRVAYCSDPTLRSVLVVTGKQ
jgi:lysine decarboxylase